MRCRHTICHVCDDEETVKLREKLAQVEQERDEAIACLRDSVSSLLDKCNCLEDCYCVPNKVVNLLRSHNLDT